MEERAKLGVNYWESEKYTTWESCAKITGSKGLNDASELAASAA